MVSSEIRLNLENYIKERLSTIFAIKRQKHYLANHPDVEIAALKEIDRLAIEIKNEILSIESEYPLFANEIFGGLFSFNDKIKFPLYVILDYISKIVSKEEINGFKKLVDRMRNVKMPIGFENNWNLSSKARDLEYASVIYYQKVVRSNYGNESYNSTIKTFNEILDTDPSGGIIGGTINSSDENLLADDLEQYPELKTEPVWVCRRRAIFDGKEIILFEEQEGDLFDKYLKLRELINKKRLEQMKNNFLQHILPYFEDKSLEIFAINEAISNSESDTAKLMVQYLENIYFSLTYAAEVMEVYVMQTLDNLRALLDINDYMNAFLNLEKMEKERVISFLVSIYLTRSRFEQKLPISLDELKDKLNRLSLLSLWGCVSKIKNERAGYQSLVRLINE